MSKSSGESYKSYAVDTSKTVIAGALLLAIAWLVARPDVMHTDALAAISKVSKESQERHTKAMEEIEKTTAKSNVVLEKMHIAIKEHNELPAHREASILFEQLIASVARIEVAVSDLTDTKAHLSMLEQELQYMHDRIANLEKRIGDNVP